MHWKRRSGASSNADRVPAALGLSAEDLLGALTAEVRPETVRLRDELRDELREIDTEVDNLRITLDRMMGND